MNVTTFSQAISRVNLESNANVSKTSNVSIFNINMADHPRKFYYKRLVSLLNMPNRPHILDQIERTHMSNMQ
jgi:hypothetical protein